jgi:hypothetical protein
VIVHREPAPEWLGRHFQCEECGREVEFELRDLRERKIRPSQDAQGRWIVSTPCEICGPMRVFIEIMATGENQLPVCERLRSDSSGSPPAVATSAEATAWAP